MAALIKRLRESEQGAEVIEMVLVLPLLLALLFGLVDFGFLFQQYLVMTNAAAEGARVASLPGYSADDVSARVAACGRLRDQWRC
jgi:Flp pilus assembly protein TadG